MYKKRNLETAWRKWYVDRILKLLGNPQVKGKKTELDVLLRLPAQGCPWSLKLLQKSICWVICDGKNFKPIKKRFIRRKVTTLFRSVDEFFLGSKFSGKFEKWKFSKIFDLKKITFIQFSMKIFDFFRPQKFSSTDLKNVVTFRLINLLLIGLKFFPSQIIHSFQWWGLEVPKTMLERRTKKVV